MQRIKKDDDVVVVAGADKGKRGKVLRVLTGSDRVVVAGVNIVTKHIKPSRSNQRGGIEKREAPIHASNVMLADPESGKPIRVGVKVLEDGRRFRIARQTGEQIDK